MKYYSVAEITVTNRRWVPAYVRNVTKIVEAHGGRYLARSVQIRKMEGDRPLPQLVVIIEWPSLEAAEIFYESEAYLPYKTSRLAGSNGEFILVSGEDINKTAQIE